MKILLISLLTLVICGCGSRCDEEGYLGSIGVTIDEFSLLENSFRGNDDVVQKLLSCGIDANARSKDGSSPLMYAANAGRPEMVAALLHHGADVSAMSKSGASALHAAAQNGSVSVISILIKAGSDKDSIGPLGRTPLFIAAESGNLDAVKELLELGANASIRDPNEWTPAHVAASNGHVSVLDALLSGKTAVTVNDAAIPLLIPAIVNQKQEVILWLLANGADPEAKSRNGETPMQIAKLVGNSEAVTVLDNTRLSPSAR